MLHITSKCNIIDLSLILGPTGTCVEPIELILFNKSLLYKLNGPVMAFCYGYTVFYFHFNVYQTVGGLCQLVLLIWFLLVDQNSSASNKCPCSRNIDTHMHGLQ